MKTNMSAYGVTELSPEEASATSGGMFWVALGAIARTVVLGAAAVAAYFYMPWD
ncbi:hypothetical protein H8B02_32695 [Bradyrhizobium sp. Pear77]|uniref:hypothetical protein n=1 Tax=Bradyrhizobium TaxID=374 RepID=UPI001E303606|nr:MULTISPECIES: hypothetical protein [Bradyrhizobium]MCC8958016.1 hypothetical protein [Bradyrhizobium altum]MCC8967125.1 hypothetical protein [Bradyrhizobium oropedii]